ncbi:uncharacterized protein JN550_003645 [Neoarthrinium moseri]|uniref:uncharacterized protein n=1 Tax=Neoarthrinium moseri TaxID=1658444 RepID=UPI001FDD0A79|nr:uncharacterized protein JN550_003645 [Neoarthrinium moseri]KAI1872771.1 hypothetical protein JN550_003645 [Neoarthrinium moseri]
MALSSKSPRPEVANPELLKRIKHIESQLAWLNQMAWLDDIGQVETRTSPIAVDQVPNTPSAATSVYPRTQRPRPPRDSTSPPERRLSQSVPHSAELDAANIPRFSTLPPHSVMQSLIDTYFLHAHNQPYSYFQEESFREGLAFGQLPKCLVYAVLATALRFSNDAYFNGAKDQATEAYAREAWLSVLNDHMTAENCPNLHVAQTTNLLAIIDFTAGRTSSGWLKIGLAVRIAQDLQLMKEPSGTSSVVEQEKCRRVFWSIYLLDKLVSCGRSRPPAIHDEDCQVQLPCDEMAFRNGYAQRTATLHQVSSWTAESNHIGGNFALAILAASALGRCARYVLHQRETDELAPWDSRSEFATINTYLLLVSHHLRVESMSVDDIVQKHQKTDGSLDCQDAGHMLFSHAVFHLCYCLLNHPILLLLRLQKLNYRVPANFLVRSLHTSCEHASMIIDILDQAATAGLPIRASFYAYATTLAGSIITIAIQAENQPSLLSVSKLQENSQQALSILERMGHVWEHASKMHQQLLLFNASDVASEIRLDSSLPLDTSPGLEDLLWPIVDYGLMCSRLKGSEAKDATSRPPPFEEVNGFSGLDFNVDIDSTEGFSGFGTDVANTMDPDYYMSSIECQL